MNSSGIIFDLDGTLLDTLEDIAYSLNRVLERHHLPPHSIESYRQFIGKGVANLLHQATGLNPADPLLITIGQEFRDDYGNHWMDHTHIYSGIPELLDHVTETGFRLAVLTNKYQEYADLNRTLYLSQWPINPFLGASNNRPLKPDPAGIHEIAKTWNIDLNRILYVGDTDTDMQTARAAGVFAIGAGWGFRNRQELEAAGADLIMETPKELRTWIDANYSTV